MFVLLFRRVETGSEDTKVHPGMHVINWEFSMMICVQQNLPFLSLFLVRKIEAELSPVRFVRTQDPAGAGRQVQHMSAIPVSILQGA